MATLVIDDLHKDYPTRGAPLRVLRGVDLALQTGDRLAVLGPSGSGKSTLLGILATIEQPTRGRVLIDDEDIAQRSGRALARYRNQSVGLVFQEHCLLPQCSALENVLLPTIALGASPPDAVDRARALLDRVGLADRCEHRPAELSGGERQRVAIARALINRPALLLADEPTGNLDRTAAERVADLLLELHAAERSILIVATHSARLAERVGRAAELDDGRLQEVSVP